MYARARIDNHRELGQVLKIQFVTSDVTRAFNDVGSDPRDDTRAVRLHLPERPGLAHDARLTGSAQSATEPLFLSIQPAESRGVIPGFGVTER